MKPLIPFVLLAIGCLASSCNERKTHKPATGPAVAEAPGTGYCLPASTVWAEEEYTQWMTRAELQYFQEQTPKGQYFAHVEGRNNAGLSEYRAVRKPLPTEQYAEAAVLWGLDDNAAFETELRSLRAGFVRKSMQVFVDASGSARHQIVWLKPIGAPSVAPPQASTTPDAPVVPPLPEPAETAAAATEPPVIPPAGDTEPEPPKTVTPAPDEKPPVATVVPPSESRKRPAPEPQTPKNFTTYTVVKGDSVEKIARRQHTSVDALMKANNMSNDALQIGQKLKIPRK